MSLLIALMLMGAVNRALCDPSDHTYTKECAPPPGIPDVIDNSTVTPSGLVYKNPLKPIEKCCPACEECVNIGGRCKIRWLPELYPEWCDFTNIDECRDYSCTCCVKCADDKCSPCVETGGECRKQCRSGELEDTKNVCSFYNNGTDGCKCCKNCEATSECVDAEGICTTDPVNCEHGTFASTGCCGGCYCCKPVLEPVIPSVCASTGGCYCSETGDDCANGYYACFGECSKTVYNNGLKTVVVAYACIPKIPISREVVCPGECVVGQYANFTGFCDCGNGPFPFRDSSAINGRIDQLALMMNQPNAPQQQQQEHRRRHPKQLFD